MSVFDPMSQFEIVVLLEGGGFVILATPFCNVQKNINQIMEFLEKTNSEKIFALFKFDVILVTGEKLTQAIFSNYSFRGLYVRPVEPQLQKEQLALQKESIEIMKKAVDGNLPGDEWKKE